MELTAAKRPFLYFPLRHHFEQTFHVPHRLDRYRAGRRMDIATATPGVIAAAIADEIGRPVDYRDVETDGAARRRHGWRRCCLAEAGGRGGQVFLCHTGPVWQEDSPRPGPAKR